jgi:hypothetical protein
VAWLFKRQHDQPSQPGRGAFVYVDFGLSVTGQNYGEIAFQDHSLIVRLHISPQRITAHQLRKYGGVWSIQEVGGHVGMEEEVFAGIMRQFKFIFEELLPDCSNPLPTNQPPQNLHQARLPPTYVTGQHENGLAMVDAFEDLRQISLEKTLNAHGQSPAIAVAQPAVHCGNIHD